MKRAVIVKVTVKTLTKKKKLSKSSSTKTKWTQSRKDCKRKCCQSCKGI